MRPQPQEDRVVVGFQALEGYMLPELLAVFDLDAQVGDGLHLPVEYLFRKPVLGDAVAQPAAGPGQGLVYRDRVAHLPQVVGRGQAGRPGPDHRHLFPGLRRAGRQVGLAGFQVDVGRVALEEADGHRLLDQGAAAFVLAGVRADPAQRRRQRQGLLDQPDGLGLHAVGQQGDVALGVAARRALLHAGADAVAVVVRQQQLEAHLPGGGDALGVGVHHHAVGHLGGAGRDEAARPLDLDHADPAGTEGLQQLVVAEGGDGGPVGLGRLEDGLAALAGHLLAV